MAAAPGASVEEGSPLGAWLAEIGEGSPLGLPSAAMAPAPLPAHDGQARGIKLTTLKSLQIHLHIRV